MRHEPDTLTWSIVAALLLVAAVFSLAINSAVNKSDTTVTWVTVIPVDAGARKLNLEIGLRIDGVLVGALSIPASATTNIKGEQTP